MTKKVKSTKTADCFTETFPKWPRGLLEGNGAETLLCDVVVVLKHFCVHEFVEYKMAMDGDYSNVKNIKKAQAYSLP